MKQLQHSEDCLHSGYRDYAVCERTDVTGVRYLSCFDCGAFEHEPILFGGRRSYLGRLSCWPDAQHTPYGHESGLLDFPNFYSMDYTFTRQIEERYPVIRTPIPIAFNPADVIAKDDATDHEGVSFREVWTDPIARILWLGHKPFMFTNQYFRGRCIGESDSLRKHPDKLLREYVVFNLNDGFTVDYEFFASIGAQLVPYLIHALEAEGLWPYFRLPGNLSLEWKYQPKTRAA